MIGIIEFEKLIEKLSKKLKKYKYIYGVPKNGSLVAISLISYGFKVVETPNEADIIVDDLIDSGRTKEKYKHYNKPFFALIDKRKLKKIEWINWWFEKDETDIKENVTRILESIGENPNREGLVSTPKRYERMFKNVFYGYRKKLKLMNDVERNSNKDDSIIPITTFTADNDELLIRDTEFISFCEHHIVPFSGKAYIGIIPNKKLLGMNKIDRIVKYYSARLQIQERLTSQISDWIWKNLKPQGVIVVIKADHFCARLQGDNGEFVTSSVKGVFEKDSTSRQEFLELMKLLEVKK